MKADPPVRRDGRCVHCKQPRRTFRSRRYGKHHAELDPFCSVECARAWFGQPDLNKQGRQNRADANHGPGGSFVRHGTVKGYRLCACDLCKAAARKAREGMAA